MTHLLTKWRAVLAAVAPAPLIACAVSNGPDAIEGDGLPADCAGGQTYPADPVEPMALGETLSPYRWPEAVHRRTGVRATLDLAQAPCALDDDIDWSPFDALLFVSIPAW